MPSAKDVYQSELLELGHGVPLYDPDPATEYDKVRIFDVGYVDSRFGRFHRVFNAALPKEHEINRQHGTPSDFVQFPSSPSSPPATFQGCALPAGAMHSSHVRVIGSDAGVFGDCISAHAKISFSVSNHQGAALVIKHPAYREDAYREKELASYMLKNYRSWLAFIQDDLGRLVDLRDMVFVTGCDLTADWATATFVEKVTECNVEFKAGSPSLGAASGSFWGRWQSSVNVPHRCGPGPVRPPTTPTTSRDARPGLDNADPEEPMYNQCIFLRAFRVCERKLRSPRIMKAAAEPKELDMDRDVESAPMILSAECDSDDNLSEDGYETDSYFVSHRQKTAHDAIMDFTLLNSDADVAIVHDSDVCKLVQLVDGDMDKLSDLEDVVMKLTDATEVNVVQGKKVVNLKDALQDIPRTNYNLQQESVEGTSAVKVDANSEMTTSPNLDAVQRLVDDSPACPAMEQNVFNLSPIPQSTETTPSVLDASSSSFPSQQSYSDVGPSTDFQPLMASIKEFYETELLELCHCVPLYDSDLASQHDKGNPFDEVSDPALAKEHEISLQHDTAVDSLLLQHTTPAIYHGNVFTIRNVYSSLVRVLGGDAISLSVFTPWTNDEHLISTFPPDKPFFGSLLDKPAAMSGLYDSSISAIDSPLFFMPHCILSDRNKPTLAIKQLRLHFDKEDVHRGKFFTQEQSLWSALQHTSVLPFLGYSFSDHSNHSPFEQSRRIEDLMESIALHCSALVLRTEGHPDHSTSLNNLANSLCIRFKQGRRTDDLGESIVLHCAALTLRPEGHPNRSSSSNNLGSLVFTRFKQDGRTEDLETITPHPIALALHPEGRRNRSSYASSKNHKLEKPRHETEACIWRYPASVLLSFPFHAAGPLLNKDGIVRYLLDDYISSYTPTPKALISGRSGTMGQLKQPQLVIVGQHKDKTERCKEGGANSKRILQVVVSQSLSHPDVQDCDFRNNRDTEHREFSGLVLQPCANGDTDAFIHSRVCKSIFSGDPECFPDSFLYWRSPDNKENCLENTPGLLRIYFCTLCYE